MSWTGRGHGGIEAPAFVMERKRGERGSGSSICGGHEESAEGQRFWCLWWRGSRKVESRVQRQDALFKTFLEQPTS